MASLNQEGYFIPRQDSEKKARKKVTKCLCPRQTVLTVLYDIATAESTKQEGWQQMDP